MELRKEDVAFIKAVFTKEKERLNRKASPYNPIIKSELLRNINTVLERLADDSYIEKKEAKKLSNNNENFIGALLKDCTGANIVVQLTAAQLGEFAKDLIGQTRQQLAREVEASRAEVYYTREQTASLLNVNPSTLWNWDKKDFLKPVRVGGLCRYRKSDIDRILTK